jgi:hypothetical protein
MERRIRQPAEDWQAPSRAQRRQAWRDPVEPPPGPGVQLGPVRVTPIRVLMLLALVGSLAYLAFAISVRDASSIPLLASGAAVLGLVFAGLAAAGVYSILQAGRVGADGRAMAMALAGGLCAIAAFGCWAGAVVLILVSQSGQ